MFYDTMTLAHHPVAPSELWTSWRPEPTIVAVLAVTAVLYHHGLTRLPARRRAALGRGPVVAFAAGMAAVAVAVASPLEAAASSLFAAHMLQHLLMVVAAPLLACGRPVVVLGQAFPARWRRPVLRFGSRRPVRRAADALVHPVVLWVAGTLVLWVWHLPSLYEAALTHDALHAAEHVSLVATAAAVWAVALGRGRGRRPLAVPVAVLLLFATSLQSSALGVVLTLAREPLYPIHVPVAPLWGLTPLEDQQLAGAMMWVPPGLVYLAVMAVLLARWFGSLDATSDPVADPVAVAGGDVPPQAVADTAPDATPYQIRVGASSIREAG